MSSRWGSGHMRRSCWSVEAWRTANRLRLQWRRGSSYRSIVDGLRWLTHARPDITFAVGYVSRFLEDPREDHWMAVQRLLRYIKGSLGQAVVFPKSGGLQLTVFSEAPPKSSEGEPGLTAFSDADMAGDVDGRKSTSVVLIFLGSSPIAWQSLKQKMVALSTCEAE